MPTLKQLPSRNWLMQIPKRRSYISESFRRQWDVEVWALAVERRIDSGQDAHHAHRDRSDNSKPLLSRAGLGADVQSRASKELAPPRSAKAAVAAASNPCEYSGVIRRS
jgi:hypothetical protein